MVLERPSLHEVTISHPPLGPVPCAPAWPSSKPSVKVVPRRGADRFFPKEVAQKQATPFPRQDLLTARNRFRPNFRGWRLDEFSIFARPPPRGGSHTPALTI